MDQLVNSLCRGDSVATFSGIEVDLCKSMADTAAQSGVIDIRPFREAEEALFHSNRVSSFGDNQAVVLEAQPRWERWKCLPAWEASMV